MYLCSLRHWRKKLLPTIPTNLMPQSLFLNVECAHLYASGARESVLARAGHRAGQHCEHFKCSSAGRYKQPAGIQRSSARQVRGAKVTGCASWSLPAPSMHFMIVDADLVVVLSYHPKTAVQAFLRTLLSQILQTPPCFVLCVCVCRKRRSLW